MESEAMAEPSKPQQPGVERAASDTPGTDPPRNRSQRRSQPRGTVRLSDRSDSFLRPGCDPVGIGSAFGNLPGVSRTQPPAAGAHDGFAIFRTRFYRWPLVNGINRGFSGGEFKRPYGTQCIEIIPGTQVPGYFQLSLRDKDGLKFSYAAGRQPGSAQ